MVLGILTDHTGKKIITFHLIITKNKLEISYRPNMTNK